MEHFLAVANRLSAHNNRLVLQCFQTHNVISLCADIIDNYSLRKFIIRVLCPEDCDEEAEMGLARETIREGLLGTLTSVVSLTRKAMDLETAEAFHRAGLDSPLVTQTASFGSVASNSCTETYALAAIEVLYSMVTSFMDCACSVSSPYSEYRHVCSKHEIYLDYFFDEEGLFLNSVFNVRLDWQTAAGCRRTYINRRMTTS